MILVAQLAFCTRPIPPSLVANTDTGCPMSTDDLPEIEDCRVSLCEVTCLWEVRRGKIRIFTCCPVTPASIYVRSRTVNTSGCKVCAVTVAGLRLVLKRRLDIGFLDVLRALQQIVLVCRPCHTLTQRPRAHGSQTFRVQEVDLTSTIRVEDVVLVTIAPCDAELVENVFGRIEECAGQGDAEVRESSGCTGPIVITMQRNTMYISFFPRIIRSSPHNETI